MRSRTQDEYDELEEYFVHRQRRPCKARRVPPSIPVHKPVDKSRTSADLAGAVSQSFESEYRTPLHLRVQEESADQSDSDDQGSEDDSEQDDDEDEDDDGDECDGYGECDGCDECEELDEEHEKDEEARRIGLATTEIEDIIQKLCLMVQKGVLGLDEPVMVDAVSTLRKIERGLGQEAIVWKQELSRSRSLFSPTVSSDEANSMRPDLLLTQGIDLSFLNLSPDEDAPITQHLRMAYPDGQRSSHDAMPVVATKSSPVNAAISRLPTVEQERDQDMCRAIRIRIMYTLGWVHQQKGEYRYGAQAFGVCSDIAKTGKRPLDALQQQALAHKQTCKDLEIKAKEQAVLESIRLQERKLAEKSNTSSASSVATSDSSSSGGHAGASSPSSVSSSERGESQKRGASGTISTLSAVWGSSLFRSNSQKSVAATVAQSQDDKPTPKLQRSKSLLFGLKSKPVEIPTTTEAKDSHHHQHHHPRAQHRTKNSQQEQLRQQSMPILTMAAHQKNAVKCGHCGQTRILMPLCVCKKVRYCNGECRLADLATHRLTGCHAAKIGSASLASTNVHSSSTPGVAL